MLLKTVQTSYVAVCAIFIPLLWTLPVANRLFWNDHAGKPELSTKAGCPNAIHGFVIRIEETFATDNVKAL